MLIIYYFQNVSTNARNQPTLALNDFILTIGEMKIYSTKESLYSVA